MSESLNNKKLLFLVIPLAFVSCVSVEDTLTDQAMSQAGSNASEIEKVLNSYDGEKKEAAEYLVRGMLGQYSLTGPGLDSIEMLYRELPQPNGSWQFDSLQLATGKIYTDMPRQKTADLQTLNADYLIRNLDDAWEQKETRSWNRDLSLSDFCELLLPYRIGDEPLTEWRKAYRAAYDSLSDKIDSATDAVAAAAVVSKALGEIHYNNKLKTPHRPATGLITAPAGFCREDCDRTVYAMRAFGIPVTIDEILVSPDNGTPHQWCVVSDTEDNTFRMFDNDRFLPTRDSVHNDGRREGKIYRRMWAINTDRIKRLSSIPDIPVELLSPRLKDVTAEYFGHNEATINTDKESGTVFLGLFTPDGYRPIDIAEKNAGRGVVFRDIEPNLIYFPVTRDGNGYRTCGNPFMLKSDGKVHEFVPDVARRERLSLKRKMPFWLHHTGRMSSVIGIRTQTGPSATGPWRNIDSISSMPTHSFYHIPVNMSDKDRYIRLLPSPLQRSQIGEVIASVDSLALERLPLSVITDNLTAGKKKLVDGNILTWTNYQVGYRDLVFRINSNKEVSNIFIIPRNDDNYVVPGEEYELFYFDRDGWKSLGKKTAEGFDITYDVPANAVLWLRNLTKGREEQIFICRDGKQLFNADMRNENIL